MTREHLLVLGLDEIYGVRWQCDKCNAAISFRLNETISLPQKCPGCATSFMDTQSFTEYEEITKLVNAVKAVRGTSVHKQLKATLKLEFSDGS